MGARENRDIPRAAAPGPERGNWYLRANVAEPVREGTSPHSSRPAPRQVCDADYDGGKEREPPKVSNVGAPTISARAPLIRLNQAMTPPPLDRHHMLRNAKSSYEPPRRSSKAWRRSLAEWPSTGQDDRLPPSDAVQLLGVLREERGLLVPAESRDDFLVGVHDFVVRAP